MEILTGRYKPILPMTVPARSPSGYGVIRTVWRFQTDRDDDGFTGAINNDLDAGHYIAYGQTTQYNKLVRIPEPPHESPIH